MIFQEPTAIAMEMPRRRFWNEWKNIRSPEFILWIRKLSLYEQNRGWAGERAFNLLVFDNHTDMQLPAFGGLLSCGGWIASALEEVEKLQEVWLIGPDEEAYGRWKNPLRTGTFFVQGEAG